MSALFLQSVVTALLIVGYAKAQVDSPAKFEKPIRPSPKVHSDSPLNRPTLGYVAAVSSPELRAILGVPGAAVFSDPLTLPGGVTRVYVAFGRAFALIERGKHEMSVVSMDGVIAGTANAIAGAVQVADSVSFSPTARSAVLISASAGRFQVITGLPDAPQVTRDLDLMTLPSPPLEAAISDDASSVLISSPGAVYLLLADGSTRVAASVADSASLAFLPNSETAAIADRTTGSVSLLQPQTGVANAAFLTTGLNSIGRISASNDGGLLYITDPAGWQIQSINTSTGQILTFALPVSPVKIDSLSNVDTFLISSEPGQPAWIFLRDGSDVRTVFVPSAISGSPQGQ